MVLSDLIYLSQAFAQWPNVLCPCDVSLHMISIFKEAKLCLFAEWGSHGSKRAYPIGHSKHQDHPRFHRKGHRSTLCGRSRQKCNILIHHNPLNQHTVFLVKQNDIIQWWIVYWLRVKMLEPGNWEIIIYKAVEPCG